MAQDLEVAREENGALAFQSSTWGGAANWQTPPLDTMREDVALSRQYVGSKLRFTVVSRAPATNDAAQVRVRIAATARARLGLFSAAVPTFQ